MATKHRTIRIADDTWDPAMALAAALGTDLSERIRGYVEWFVATGGAALPAAPADVEELS